MRQPTIAVGLVAGLLSFIAGRGADAGTLCRQCSIDPKALSDPDNRLPFAHFVALLRLGQQVVGDQALALHFGTEIGMAEMSILGLIMEASATMGEAFQQMQRYGRLALDLGGETQVERFGLVAQSGQLLLVDHRPDPNVFPELTEMAFAQLVCGPRRFLSQPHVLAVHVTHAPPLHRSAYVAVFRCPVHFNSALNALELHPEVASWPVARNPRYVFGVLCDKADGLLAMEDVSGTLRSRLGAMLQPKLHEGNISADDTASRLGWSRSTLFRRLRDEGTSFSVVIEDLRREMAIRYLRGGRVSISETAYLTGFSDPSAFSRAFHRWTGEVPGRFKKKSGSHTQDGTEL